MQRGFSRKCQIFASAHLLLVKSTAILRYERHIGMDVHKKISALTLRLSFKANVTVCPRWTSGRTGHGTVQSRKWGPKRKKSETKVNWSSQQLSVSSIWLVRTTAAEAGFRSVHTSTLLLFYQPKRRKQKLF